MIELNGTCPVCNKATRFRSSDDWYRDHLLCANCGSIPRERAFSHFLDGLIPDWPELRIHESSPAQRAVSQRIAQRCKAYQASQFFADLPRGAQRNGVQSEDLENLTFADGNFDLHLHLDVMEHVNRPGRAFVEMARTLTPKGKVLFSVPVHADRAVTRRRAVYFSEGVEHLLPPDYHGNPISDDGALVTFDYGQDFSDLIRQWTPDFSVLRLDLNAPHLGIIGQFRDIWLLERQG